MGKLLLSLAMLLAIGAAPDDSNSPKQPLLAQDAAAQAGNVEADLGFYVAKGDPQQKLARAIAEGDVALAMLQSAVARQFGADLATAVVHAAGVEDARDIQAATEKIDADHATIEFKDGSNPLRMICADGKWKIS